MTTDDPARSAVEPPEDSPLPRAPEDLWVGKSPARPAPGADDDATVADLPPVDDTKLNAAYFERTPFGDAATQEPSDTLPFDLPAPAPRQEARPHKWYTKAWHSVSCYVVVMTLLATLFGWSVFAAHQSSGTFSYALSVSVLFGSFVLLRLVRGSALDAQRRKRAYLHDRIGRISDPSAILSDDEYWVSERIADEIDITNEPVLMEVRLHPVNILVALVHNTRKTAVRSIAAIYVIGVSALAALLIPPGYAWLWCALVGVVVGIAVYVWLTIADWYRCYFAITANRFIKVHGLIGTDAPSMLRSQITDVAVTVPWYSKVLQWLRIIDVAFGTWRVESPGQVQGLEYIKQMRWARELAVVIGLGRRAPN